MTAAAVVSRPSMRKAAGRPDSVCLKAVDVARAGLAGVAQEGSVGAHLSAVASGERLVTHSFECTAKAYRGWIWTVTVARAPRAKAPTVCEVELLAGDLAIQAPAHLPWEDRLRPGDVGAGDVLARIDPDVRLVAGFEATGEEDVDAVAHWELGLGRPRVLSAQGRAEAADRWSDGDFGPSAPAAAASKEQCATCGFMMPVTGALRPVFGVCANEWSPADGRVVSLGYGCGAHSETDVEKQPERASDLVLDEFTVETVSLPDLPAPAAADEGAEEPPAAGVDSSEAEGVVTSEADDAADDAQPPPSDDAGPPPSEPAPVAEQAEPAEQSEPAESGDSD